MSFTVSSDLLSGTIFGQKLTDKELSEMGVNIDALVSGGHLTPDVTSTPNKSTTLEGA